MADHSLPVLTSLYADYTTALKARHDDALKMLDPATTSPTNVPTNAIRFSSAAAKWQKWDGSAWVDPVVSYAINITGNVTGNVTGNLTGNAGTATALATARTIGGVSFNGTANIDLPGVNTAGNQNTTGNAATATKINSLGQYAATAVGTTRGSTGVNLYDAYNNSYPTAYGNVLHLRGAGANQLLLGWSGADGAHADNYIRSKRDNDTGAWSGWAKLITDQNIGSQTAGVLAATAGASAGAVGTYVFAVSYGGSMMLGSTTAGINLTPASAAEEQGTVLLGTWRCMGAVTPFSTGSGNRYATLWLRIA